MGDLLTGYDGQSISYDAIGIDCSTGILQAKEADIGATIFEKCDREEDVAMQIMYIVESRGVWIIDYLVNLLTKGGQSKK